MKVERIEPKTVFVPIVITLETEEEATHLWHRLNAAPAVSFERYCQPKGIELGMSVNSLMWYELNRAYTPKEEYQCQTT